MRKKLWILLGLFLGPLLACMVLAVLAVRVNSKMLAVSMVLGLLTGGFVIFKGASSLWVAPVAFSVSLIIGMAGTWIFGADKLKA